jgi:hyaluronan synthase
MYTDANKKKKEIKMIIHHQKPIDIPRLPITAVPASGAIAIKPRRKLNWELFEPLAKFLVLALALGVVAWALKKDLLFDVWVQRALKDHSPFFRYMFMFNASMFLGALVLRTVLWFRYRPYDSAKVTEWPEITVVVPAYNEGETVFNTICSIAENNYPSDKLKIIAVDDGSRDDTHTHMERARDRYPALVRLVRFPRNRGKREGIYRSYRFCRSPYLATVDSDTRLEPGALQELVTPLVLNPGLGAVTGRIRIWNSSANILTKMLKANFAMAFDFSRAIQSTFSTVFCTSGAFSVYRRSILDQVIHQWRGQTFLKRRCTYGEDRSLANYILRTGAGTAFQRTAVAFTKVPETLFRILKMMTRWARSNIRESIIFSRIMFNPRRKGNYLFPFLEFLFTIVIVFVHIAMFYYLLFSGLVNGDFILRALAYTVLFGFFYMLYYMRIEGYKDFPYILVFSIFSAFFMVWIFTVSFFTVNTRTWSTR